MRTKNQEKQLGCSWLCSADGVHFKFVPSFCKYYAYNTIDSYFSHVYSKFHRIYRIFVPKFTNLSAS